MNKIAVIDLGTNGFRLYIAESPAIGIYNIIHRESDELKLASEGIECIGKAPFARGLAAMQHFATVLKEKNVDRVQAFGTAALRLASNGHDFINTVQRETGINIQLISGEREAELIYKGMRNNIPLSTEPILMIDVGGGSVEFIIANSEKVFWSRSFNVGVTILKQNFHHADPIRMEEVQAIRHFLNQECAELLEKINLFKPQIPAIACGTLDFLVKILRGGKLEKFEVFSAVEFQNFYQTLTFMTDDALANTPDVPIDKVEMLAVSMVLMDWVMQELNADQLIASAFSMKAGILYEMTMG
jgi:exopolyphosphatase / guanosine-5'-triphosphate,3'-diphosphate pyrophosphatase